MGTQQSQNRIPVPTKRIDSPHPMMNNTSIVRSRNQLRLKAQWPFFSQETYKNWEKNYHNYLQKVFNTQKIEQVKEEVVHYLLLPRESGYSKVNVCSPTGVVFMEYQFIQQTLVQDIQARGLANHPYLEYQLWILIHIVSKTANYLHKRGVFIGDIRSQNVFVDFIARQVKLVTEVSWISQPGPFQKHNNNWGIFVTPEVLNGWSRRETVNLMSNDGFQLGIMLAESILLEDLSKIYQKDGINKILRKQKIDQIIEKLLKIKYYSVKLLLLVAGLISFNFQERITIKEVCQLLKIFQKQIFIGKTFHLSKQHFNKILGSKVEVLEGMISRVSVKTGRQLGQKKDLIGSRTFTLNNEISEVQNVKRTFDDNSNISILNSMFNEAKLSPGRGQISSKNTSQKTQKFPSGRTQQPPKINFSKTENTSNSKKMTYKSNSNQRDIFYDKKQDSVTPFWQSEKQEASSTKLDNIYAVSEVKQLRFPFQIPFGTHEEELVPKRLYEDNKQITQNFSFRSPQVHDQIAKVQDISSLTLRQFLDSGSFAKSTQTLLMAPSVYSVSNPPSSYISYHYTKSIQKDKSKQKDSQRQNDASYHFDFQLPKCIRKQSQQKSLLQPNVIDFQELKRRTISAGIWDVEKQKARNQQIRIDLQ